jgi:cell division protease FtsH
VGLSDLGPLAFGRKEGEVFLGRDMVQQQEYSEKTALEIDEGSQKIINRNYDRSKKLLQEKLDILHRLATALLEFESLDGEQIDQAIRGDKVTIDPHADLIDSAPSDGPATGDVRKSPGFRPSPSPARRDPRGRNSTSPVART